MKKPVKFMSLMTAVAIAGALSACGGGSGEVTEDYSSMNFVVGAYRDLRTDPYNNSYSIGADKFMEEYPGSTVEFVIHKNNEELVTAIASDSAWDVQLSIMSPLPSVFKQAIFEDLTDYVDKKNPIYTPQLLDEATLGKGLFGLSNVVMGDLVYAIYNEDMFLDYGIKTPYEYYEEGEWTWDNFIKMTDDLQKNDLKLAVTWEKPYLNRRYGLVWNDDYTVSSMYDSQQQRDWLNFVRTLVYDKGILDARNANKDNGVAKRENAMRIEILPHLMVAANQNTTADTIRYIPWATKDGEPDSMYVVDYYFCVPTGAKSIGGSVELINHMIESCTEDRMNMYEQNMLPEDFEVFKKSLEDFYTITWIDGYGYSERELINEFAAGKAVSQHISEVKDMLDAACEAHNETVKARNGQLVGADIEAAENTVADE